VISTVFPTIDVTRLLVVLGLIGAVGLTVGTGWSWLSRRGEAREPEVSRAERENWRMPALALLERPAWSVQRRVTVYGLGGYLVLAIVMLAVKAVQLAIQA
jgi:hypothetical protein